MIVAIPSKGRTDRVASQRVIPSACVYVPAGEVDDYERCGVANVVAVPGAVRGITATRNWILDNAECERVVFVDDDVRAAGWIEFEEERSVHRRMDEAAWLVEFARLFDVAEDAGLRVWGVDTCGAPRSTYPYRPFILHTYVTASCMGMWARGPRALRFDEAFAVKEDYELCLRCLKEDGGVLGARYIYWSNGHWTDRGGCGDYCTQAMELDAIRRLVEKYPGMIRRVTRGGSRYSIEIEF